MSFQRKVLAWAVEMFGPIAQNRDERAARFLEEAAETAQAAGLPHDVAERILDRVYARPGGDLAMEIGAAALTLDALAENVGVNVEEARREEWVRVSRRPREWWEARHREKAAAGTADLTP